MVKMILNDLIEKYKNNQAGKKLHDSQKDIDLLTMEELAQEITYVISKYKKE